MKRVLITGAAGFLGSHLTDLMLAQGCEVVGLDNLSHGCVANLQDAMSHPKFHFCDVDIRDEHALRGVAEGVDTVVHLAALKIPRYGGALETLMVNSEGTMHVLRLAAAQKARFVITSTSDVYGKNPNLPFAETHDSVIGPPTVARWAYATSKMFDEHLVMAAADEWGLNASIIRIFGSYGPRQNLSWWGGPQSVFIDAVLKNEIIPLHGDGMQTRSFTFVRDTVRGILAVVKADHISKEIVNIGSNREISIVGLAEMVHRLCATGYPLRIEHTPYDEIAGRKYEDVRRRVPDIEKARQLLGFEALTPLETGLLETIEWQRSVRENEAAAFQLA